jgi:hypothetical protein
MNCEGFDRWLDDGLPEALAPPANAHAGSCPRCARALLAARALERLLSEPPAPAPARFTVEVMRRVAWLEAARARGPVVVATSPLPWWVEAAAEPSAALAFALAGVVLWQGRALVAAAGWSAARVTPLVEGVSTTLMVRVAETFTPPVMAGLGLAFLPLFAWLAWRLYRISERMALAVAAA